MRWRTYLLIALSLSVVGCGDDDAENVENVENGENGENGETARITELPGVDTSGLTGPGDRAMWEGLVNDLLSPCGQPVSVAQCIADDVECGACRPAAAYLSRLVQEGLERGEVRDLYRGRYSGDPLVIPIEGAPAKGALMGDPLTIVEFSDFECPYCGLVTPILREVLHEYEGRIRIVFKQYPLSMHENADPAARASIAAMRQGKFWEMHDLLFGNQQALSASDLVGYATELELDIAQFERDMEDPETAALIELNRSEGQEVGVNSTPSLYIDGRRFEEPHENLSAFVGEALAAR